MVLDSMAMQQHQEALHKEGRLILALQAYKPGQIKTFEAAAKLYNVGGPSHGDGCHLIDHAKRLSHPNETATTWDILLIVPFKSPPS